METICRLFIFFEDEINLSLVLLQTLFLICSTLSVSQQLGVQNRIQQSLQEVNFFVLKYLLRNASEYSACWTAWTNKL